MFGESGNSEGMRWFSVEECRRLEQLSKNGEIFIGVVFIFYVLYMRNIMI